MGCDVSGEGNVRVVIVVVVVWLEFDSGSGSSSGGGITGISGVSSRCKLTLTHIGIIITPTHLDINYRFIDFLM